MFKRDIRVIRTAYNAKYKRFLDNWATLWYYKDVIRKANLETE